MSDAMKVFIGWDSREDIAYQVCRHSLLRHASGPVEAIPLKQEELRDRGLYEKEADPLASTEFTYTRFLVPELCGFEGWGLFCDCDFLWLGDVTELRAKQDPDKALLCVQHDYRPTEKTKMDGAVQTVYPRKNWSSLMLFNCGHPANRVLTHDLVNREGGAFLHRFQWLDDSLIGELEPSWNWLEGWTKNVSDLEPKAIHYTRGGPWFEDWQDVDYADLWIAERDRVEAEGLS